MIQNTNTYEAYEALEQAEEGDILDYTPHELTNAISENVSYVRNIIQTATEKKYRWLQHVLLWNSKSDTHQFVLGRYGHNDMDVDRGFRVVQTGDTINAEYNGSIDTDVFNDVELSEEEVSKLVSKIKENLIRSETNVEEMLVDSWYDSIEMSDNRVDFTARSAMHYYAGDRPTKNRITELEEKYDIDNLHGLIQVAIHSNNNEMFSYNIQLE